MREIEKKISKNFGDFSVNEEKPRKICVSEKPQFEEKCYGNTNNK